MLVMHSFRGTVIFSIEDLQQFDSCNDTTYLFDLTFAATHFWQGILKFLLFISEHVTVKETFYGSSFILRAASIILK